MLSLLPLFLLCSVLSLPSEIPFFTGDRQPGLPFLVDRTGLPPQFHSISRFLFPSSSHPSFLFLPPVSLPPPFFSAQFHPEFNSVLLVSVIFPLPFKPHRNVNGFFFSVFQSSHLGNRD